MGDYNFHEIEEKWQKFWEEKETFSAKNFGDQPHYYVLDMFPYPSGTGLHIGHPEGYTASDILARYHMALGYNVLHPMGWDAFGLPAEQHAIQTGIDPSTNTQANIDSFRRQIKRIGFAIDWSREINTTSPSYYRWTQWIFLQLFKHDLAFVDGRPVWWCPALKSVLANEEIVNGLSERGNHPVERRPMRQWVLRITHYAEKLLDGLQELDWPESTKRQQIAWIGKSEGLEIDFSIAGMNLSFAVFTTRPDTLLGVTHLIMAPEHPLLGKIVAENDRQRVQDYQAAAARKSDLDRTELAKEKTGVFSGAHAIHPLTGISLPIWISDYVLISYGSGAIMCVPAHDERDFEFATHFQLPIERVICSAPGVADALPYLPRGILCNSGVYDGLTSDEAQEAIAAKLIAQNRGKKTVNYRLRDWIFSRQRYWGEPIPILWVSEEDYECIGQCEGSIFHGLLPLEAVYYEENGERAYAIPLPYSQLPLQLPAVESYLPSDSGESPLGNADDWLFVWVHPQTGEVRSQAETRPAEEWISAKRETNTMPQWAGSCWYHLRYMSPHCTANPVDPEAVFYWRAPDFYIGGAEHAVLHLLYARFWHRFLYDIGTVPNQEPYPRLFHQGIILGEDGEKMSKSRGNVINPDSIIKKYGADTLRLYEMFLGPLEAVKPWDTQGIEGIVRFLRRTWKLLSAEDPSLIFLPIEEENREWLRTLHTSIKKVREDIEKLRFNTAISQLMILLNHMQRQEHVSMESRRIFVQLLAPFAPHICEELWQRMGNEESVTRCPFPEYDESYLAKRMSIVVVQINGRRRGEICVDSDSPQDLILELARNDATIVAHLEGREILREIYVPNKIVNFVVL